MEEVLDTFTHAVMISAFVFLMMLIVDYINVLSKGRMTTVVKGGSLRQYIMASFLGATPGCLGAFMNVSFYVHGLLSFGAIVGGMIATSGDEAFVMLALFPGKALLLFGLLFGLGIIFAWIADRIASVVGIVPCQECRLHEVHFDEECHCFEPRALSDIYLPRFFLLLALLFFLIAFGIGLFGPKAWNWQKITLFSLLIATTGIVATVPAHYLKEHIWSHIIREHLWRVFLWTFFALLFINIGLEYWNLEGFVKGNIGWVLLIAALSGIIPESGPHLIFVMMFMNGVAPFSVLLTSSFVQDGHGMLPLLSYTVRDSILIKIFNLVFGLVVGFIVYLLGF
jgi:hypothetical protein